MIKRKLSSLDYVKNIDISLIKLKYISFSSPVQKLLSYAE